MSVGIGEAQVYLGGVDDQFGCHLVSVKPRCIWVGLMIGLNDIWHRVSLPLNQNIHVFCLSVSVKPRCTWVALMISLGVIWYR